MFHILNRVTSVSYQADSIFAPTARLIVLHPNVETPQELIIKGGEGIIVTKDGSLKYCTGKKIVPIDNEGHNLNRR